MHSPNMCFCSWLLLMLLLTACGQSVRSGSTSKPLLTRSHIIKMDSLDERDSELEKFLKPYSEQVRFTASQPLGWLSRSLGPLPENDDLLPLVARLVAAELAMENDLKADMIILEQTIGFARLDSGTVTLGDIYRIAAREQPLLYFHADDATYRTFAKNIAAQTGLSVHAMPMQGEASRLIVTTEQVAMHEAFALTALQGVLTPLDIGLRQLLIRGCRRAGEIAIDRFLDSKTPLSVGAADES